jgi:hypothetical protein
MSNQQKIYKLGVGGGGGAFSYGKDGFLYKKNGNVGARRSTKFNPGGNSNSNASNYSYNKYSPGNSGIGGQSIAVRRAKNKHAVICSPNQPCGEFYNSLGKDNTSNKNIGRNNHNKPNYPIYPIF